MSIRCQICGSTHINTTITTDSKYSVGKGLIGTALFGAGGAVMGVNGKQTEKKLFICQDCGWDSTGTLSTSECERIETALKNNDIKSLKKLKEYYKNIEWDESDTISPLSENIPPTTKNERKTSIDSPKQQTVKNIIICGDVNTTSLLKRAFIFLEEGEWEQADEQFEIVLNATPECAEAYLGKLMIDLQLTTEEEFETCEQDYEENANYKKILKFANDKLKNKFEYWLKKQRENENKREKIEVEISKYREKILPFQSLIALDNSYLHSPNTIGLRQDGSVVATGANDEGQCIVEDWSDIVNIYCTDRCTIGLREDGTVIATRDNYTSQVKDWAEIKNIICSAHGIIGLRKDGTAVSAGLLYDDSEIHIARWQNIKEIFGDGRGSLFCGLCNDGTIVCTGFNNEMEATICTWENIIKITIIDKNCVLGLKDDGRILVAGNTNEIEISNATEWRNIIDVLSTHSFLIGLRRDGSVKVLARKFHEREKSKIEAWTNIVAISGCHANIVGLCQDGSIVSSYDSESWTDIVAIAASIDYIIGIQKDGTVLASCKEKSNRCNVEGWKLFEDFETYAQDRDIIFEKRKKEKEDRIKAEQEAKLQRELEQKRMAEERQRARKERERQKAAWRTNNLCQYCGGTFKGFIFKKCTNCGNSKDY